MMKVGIIGAGAMGSGIAQIAAQNGHPVYIIDTHRSALDKSQKGHEKIMARLVEKGRISAEEARAVHKNLHYHTNLDQLCDCGLIIEAVVEDLAVKKDIFVNLCKLSQPDAILASNTSSLSIASIGAAVKDPSRLLGLHFFNPAPLMPLVEVIPAITTSEERFEQAYQLMKDWGKTPVRAKDTPGFIVNRVARPFYGEAVRIYEEGFADPATIDWALTELGGFRMGPFTLMDFIGHDVNYAVTESVFEAFYYDPRYRPNFTQKRLVEAGLLGRKAGRGFYDYAEGAENKEPNKDQELGEHLLWRILVMLINEAADALYLKIASASDIELAMTKGVNYPKGLLAWANEKGIEHCVETLDRLHSEYHEDRYRCSPLLRKMLREGENFPV